MIVRAIRAELVKTTTVRATRWLLGGSIVGALAITVIIALVTRRVADTIDEEAVLALGPLTGFGGLPGIAIIVGAVIGVLSMTTEYRFNTLRTTFLAVPNRWIALIAKTIVISVLSALVYWIAALVSLIVFSVIVHGSPIATLRTVGAHVLTFPLGVMFAVILGVAAGGALRNGAGAVTLVLAYLFVVDNVISSIPYTRDAEPYLLLSNLQNFMGVLMSSDFPWSSAGSFGYLVVVIGALWGGACALVARRDA